MPVSTSVTEPQEYKTILIAGASGNLGQILAKELLAEGSFDVLLLCPYNERSAKYSIYKELDNKGATLCYADYKDMNALVDIMKEVDVVLSTLNNDAIINEQVILLEAANKCSNVKLFIPSEFGLDLNRIDMPTPLFEQKKAFRKRMHESGNHVKHLLLLNGFFIDMAFTSDWLGIDIPRHYLRIFGKKETSLPWIHRADIGRYLVYLFQHPSLIPNHSAQYYMVTEYKSMGEIHKLLEKTTSQTFQVEEIRDLTLTKNNIIENKYSMDTFPQQLFVLADEGKISFEEPKQMALKEAPAFKDLPHKITIEKYLAALEEQQIEH